jgi:hypothetical protein
VWLGDRVMALERLLGGARAVIAQLGPESLAALHDSVRALDAWIYWSQT